MLKDYDCTIEYHPRKINVVADALSRKPRVSRGSLSAIKYALLSELRNSNGVLRIGEEGSLLAYFQVCPTLIDEVISKQPGYPILKKITEKVEAKQRTNYEIKNNGALLKDGRLCVPNNDILKNAILRKHIAQLTVCILATRRCT